MSEQTREKVGSVVMNASKYDEHGKHIKERLLDDFGRSMTRTRGREGGPVFVLHEVSRPW